MTAPNKPAGSARPVTGIRQIGDTIVHHSAVVYVNDYEDLDNWPLLCSRGRHLGFLINDPIMAKVEGWGPINSWEVWYSCDCGRWRYDVTDRDTGETISRSVQYGGGQLPRCARDTERAKKVWLDRVEARRTAALTAAADVAADIPAPKRRRRRARSDSA